MKMSNALGFVVLFLATRCFSLCGAEFSLRKLKALPFYPTHTELFSSDGDLSLEAYCAQAESSDKFQGNSFRYVVGQPVKADWFEFGVYYDAHISAVNKDGTYNVIYIMDDRHEKGVKRSSLQPRKIGPKNIDPKDDPACALKHDIEDLSEKIDGAAKEIAGYIAARKKTREAVAERRGAADNSPGSSSQPHPPRIKEAPSGVRMPPGVPQAGGLPAILDKVDEVGDEVEVIVAKKHKLDKAGKMDAELGAAIDDAVARQNSVKEKTKALQKAIAEEAKAQAELNTAVEEDTVASTAGSQGQEAQGLAETEVEAADAKVDDCLLELQTGLRDSRQSAQKFDREVTPSGAKWWRFRYEYSYMEAILMLCIIPLMVLYKFLYNTLRDRERGMVHRSTFSRLLRQIQSMRMAWLQFAVGEMFVCFCVAITVWLMFTFGIFDPLIVHIYDASLHLPTTPEHYQVLATNVCMQLGLAILAYQVIVYSVVRATLAKFHTWDAYEAEKTPSSPAQSMSMGASMSLTRKLKRGPTLMGGPFEFSQMRSYFLEETAKYPGIKDKLATLECDSTGAFPFGAYLSVNVRLYTDDILQLTYNFWLAAWVTFGVFVLLHRFAHMAYVRIMTFVSLLLVAVLLGMYFAVMSTTRRMTECVDDAEEDEQELQSGGAHNHWISLLLQYTLFFLCYGFVRMVTAPWLWHIYFYNVLILTCIFAAVLLAFAAYLAPLIPVFYAAMSIPPNISETDLDIIVHAMKKKDQAADDHDPSDTHENYAQRFRIDTVPETTEGEQGLETPT